MPAHADMHAYAFKEETLPRLVSVVKPVIAQADTGSTELNGLGKHVGLGWLVWTPGLQAHSQYEACG